MMINDIKKNYNSLTKKEYFQLLFTKEDICRNLLIKRASQFWWLNNSDKIISGGYNSPHFALKRYNNNNN